MSKGKGRYLQGEAWDVLRAAPQGLTRVEVAERLRLPLHNAGHALCGLKKQGRAINTGGGRGTIWKARGARPTDIRGQNRRSLVNLQISDAERIARLPQFREQAKLAQVAAAKPIAADGGCELHWHWPMPPDPRHFEGATMQRFPRIPLCGILESAGRCGVVKREMDAKRALRSYRAQKSNAKRRGIGWELTFHQWCEWWGEDIDRRGAGHDKLCMQRVADTGPYALDNIRKGYPLDNARTAGRMTLKRNGAKAVAERIRTDGPTASSYEHGPHEDEYLTENEKFHALRGRLRSSLEL